jgi:hypothetical protein
MANALQKSFCPCKGKQCLWQTGNLCCTACRRIRSKVLHRDLTSLTSPYSAFILRCHSPVIFVRGGVTYARRCGGPKPRPGPFRSLEWFPKVSRHFCRIHPLDPDEQSLLQYAYFQEGAIIASLLKQLAGVYRTRASLRHVVLAFAASSLPPEKFENRVEFHKAQACTRLK